MTNIDLVSDRKPRQPAIQRNIKDLKSKSVRQVGISKAEIETVHAQLRQSKGMQEELLQLISLETHLPQFMRHEFLNHPTQGQMLPKLKALNGAFVPVLDYLTCYKSEIGLCLQRMVESYNLLILQQFEGFFTTENAKTREYNEKIKKLDILAAETNNQKKEQDMKEDFV